MRALIARLKAVLTPARGPVTPLPEPAVAALEQRVAALEQLSEAAVEREMKWQEMNAQLRRFLGRLDAHAGRAEQQQQNGSARGLHARSDVIAAKFPHGLPSKE